MFSKSEKTIISLVKNAFTQNTDNISSDFDTDMILKFGSKHHIMSILFSGASKSGFDKNSDFMKKLFAYSGRESIKHELQWQEIEVLYDAFCKNSVKFLPLKGLLTKKLYPKSWMRVMGDADILIDSNQYDEIKKVITELGYTFVTESDHEYIWKKEGRLLLELHKRLIPSYNEDYYRYFGDGFSKSKPKYENAYEYEFSSEDEFIYIFTHFAKHYRDGGIGIKHFTDLYVFTNAHSDMDFVYIETELKKLSLLEFYKNTVSSLRVWFENADADETCALLIKTVIGSSAYGTREGHISSSALRSSTGRQSNNVTASFLKNRLFPSINYMKIKYKYLEKAPYLIPFAYTSRFLNLIFNKQERIKKYRDDMKYVSSHDISNYRNNLKKVGLTFDFKENNK